MNDRSGKLNIQAVVLIIFLVIQYALGMAANLFVQFPQNVSAGRLWVFAGSQTLIASHIVLGVLLLIGAAVFVGRAIRNKSQVWIIVSSIGLLAIIAAWGSGALFIPTQSSLYSYGMSIAFLVALIAYGYGLYLNRNR
jgi:hypothetical protein